MPDPTEDRRVMRNAEIYKEYMRMIKYEKCLEDIELEVDEKMKLLQARKNKKKGRNDRVRAPKKRRNWTINNIEDYDNLW